MDLVFYLGAYLMTVVISYLVIERIKRIMREQGYKNRIALGGLLDVISVIPGLNIIMILVVIFTKLKD